MHALRHFYASSLLDAGESIRAVSEYLGHASAAFTLRTYTHLMPASQDRTRGAIDGLLGGAGLMTAWQRMRALKRQVRTDDSASSASTPTAGRSG